MAEESLSSGQQLQGGIGFSGGYEDRSIQYHSFDSVHLSVTPLLSVRALSAQWRRRRRKSFRCRKDDGDPGARGQTHGSKSFSVGLTCTRFVQNIKRYLFVSA